MFPAFFLALLAGGELRSGRRAVAAACLGAAIALVLVPLVPPGVPVIAASAAALLGLWGRPSPRSRGSRSLRERRVGDDRGARPRDGGDPRGRTGAGRGRDLHPRLFGVIALLAPALLAALVVTETFGGPDGSLEVDERAAGVAAGGARSPSAPRSCS